MKAFILVFTVALLFNVQARRLMHGLSLDDIASMPVDALQPAFSGDFSGAAQKYAMSKAGLSQSKTIGSYFGREQPQAPLSGLSSFFGANNNTNLNKGNENLGVQSTNAQVNQPAPNQNQEQGGFTGLLNKFTGGNNNNQASNQNTQIQQNQQQQQGGLSGLLSKFTGGNNKNQVPQNFQSSQQQGGFSGLLSKLTGGNNNSQNIPPQQQQGGLSGLISKFTGGNQGQNGQSQGGLSDLVSGFFNKNQNSGATTGQNSGSFLGRLFG